jgi:hypothetical protein
MKNPFRILNLLIFFFPAICFSFPLHASAQQPSPGKDSLTRVFRKWVKLNSTEKLSLLCDKPLYSPGETVWFSVFLSPSSPAISRLSEIVYVEVLNPKGSLEKKFSLVARNGTANGDYALPADAPGGIYKFRCYTLWSEQQGRSCTRGIQVQDYELPNYRLSLELNRKSYRPGDEIRAELQADDVDNKPLSGARLDFSIVAGSQVLWQAAAASADLAGHFSLRCVLPPVAPGAKPALVCRVSRPGEGPEFISANIPLVETNPTVRFFPEGGDFVQGRIAAIAFRLLKEDSTTCDASGWLTDNEGKRLMVVKTQHDGMGVFSFTPSAGKSYRIEWESPLRFSSLLPEALEKGYSLAAENQGKEIRVNYAGIVPEKIHLLVRQRDQLLFSRTVQAGSSFSSLSIPVSSWQPGLAILSLFDSRGMLRCERMVFVNPDKKLNIRISTDKPEYGTREKVQVSVSVTDPAGIPVPAKIVLGVCNDGLLRYAADRQGNLLSGLLLEQELDAKIDQPAWYFSGKPEAIKALDLLMLTYGWRGISWEHMLKEEPSGPATGPEKAVIEGTIINEVDQKPLRGATLEIGKIKVISDSNGHFRFPFIDLHKPAMVKIKWKKYPVVERTITAYSAQTLLYYSPYPVLFEKMVPMAAAAMEMQADGNQELKARRNQLMPGAKAAPVRQKEVAQVPFRRGIILPPPPIILPREEDLQESPYYLSRKFPDLPPSKSAQRKDFRTTLYWSGAVELDRNGRGHFSFHTADDLRTWRITAQALGPENLPGVQDAFFSTVLPFSVSAKLPIELVAGDEVEIPVTVRNRSSRSIKTGLRFDYDGDNIQIIRNLPDSISLASGESRELPLRIRAIRAGRDSCFMALSLCAGAECDTWQKSLKIVPAGYPQSLAFSGSSMQAAYLAELKDPVPGSVEGKVRIFPDVTSDLLTGVESILAEPFGCFEQTSMSSYPNTLVLSYLRQDPAKNPELIKRSEELLGKGYKMLTSFETKQKGYEWFGGTPAHEALTAYGLMQFKDMQKVAPATVDEEMIRRTSEWLLSRRDGKGGFLRSEQALDNFGRAAEDITNAYILYGLAEAGFQQLELEVKTASAKALEMKDPYVLALMSNTLWLLNKKEAAREMMQAMISTRKEDGSWTGTRHSITYSTGQALMVETTGFAILALIRSGEADRAIVEKAVSVLVAQRQGRGGFGNSQATIVALKALTAFVVYSKRTLEDGAFRLVVNKDSAASAKWPAGAQKTIEAGGWENRLKSGRNELDFSYSVLTQPLPYTISIDYFSNLPATHPQAALQISTRLSSDKTLAGKPVQMDVELKNTSQEGKPMSMACVSVPGGCSVAPAELKELVESRKVDFYEIRGNRLFFYFRQLAPLEVKKISLNLMPELKGKFTASAASAYLYYTAEKKYWAPGTFLEIQ